MAARTKIHATVALGALAVVALLAACQQDGMGSSLSSMPGYGLHLIDDGDSAKLAYGEANSDNVGLMLECAKGSRNVEISDVARGSDTSLLLKSGDRQSRFGGEIMPGPGASIISASGSLSAPALTAFRDSGRIEVENGGRRYGVTATPGEQAEIRRFFAMCGQA